MMYRSPFRFLLESLEGLFLLPIVFLTWPVSKRWLRQWGSSAVERGEPRPGDDVVSSQQEIFTRAIDVAAPADVVWSWVVQFGLDRAGFYSYELLERMAGISVKNVESVEPSLQSLSVGEEILLHPKAPGIEVAMIEPGRYVCFGENAETIRSGASIDPYRSWSIYVDPVTTATSRLLVRSCVEPLRKATWEKLIAHRLEEPIDFLMEQRMLRTIRRLAEGYVREKSRMAGALAG